MSTTESRLYAVMERVAPDAARFGAAPLAQNADVALTELGFDSMALIALFVELEQEFGLSIEALSACLHKRCTLHALLALLPPTLAAQA